MILILVRLLLFVTDTKYVGMLTNHFIQIKCGIDRKLILYKLFISLIFFSDPVGNNILQLGRAARNAYVENNFL